MGLARSTYLLTMEGSIPFVSEKMAHERMVLVRKLAAELRNDKCYMNLSNIELIVAGEKYSGWVKLYGKCMIAYINAIQKKLGEPIFYEDSPDQSYEMFGSVCGRYLMQNGCFDSVEENYLFIGNEYDAVGISEFLEEFMHWYNLDYNENDEKSDEKSDDTADVYPAEWFEQVDEALFSIAYLLMGEETEQTRTVCKNIAWMLVQVVPCESSDSLGSNPRMVSRFLEEIRQYWDDQGDHGICVSMCRSRKLYRFLCEYENSPLCEEISLCLEFLNWLQDLNGITGYTVDHEAQEVRVYLTQEVFNAEGDILNGMEYLTRQGLLALKLLEVIEI